MGRGRRHLLATVAGIVPVLLAVANPVAGMPLADAARPPVVPAWVGPGLTAKGLISPALRAASGPADLVVRLSRPSLSESVAESAVRSKDLPSQAAQHTVVAAANAQQDQVAAAAETVTGATEVTRVDVAVNALVVHVDDAAKAGAIAALPGVVSVGRSGVSQLDQSPPGTSVGDLSLAGAALELDHARAQGLNGVGVKVAVLDSGIDFTHANLGGPGTAAFYHHCYAGDDGAAYTRAPAGDCAQYFGPAAPKVVGGYDFVGERWDGPGDVLEKDPNPIAA